MTTTNLPNLTDHAETAAALRDAGLYVIVKHYKSQRSAQRYGARQGLTIVTDSRGLIYLGVRGVAALDILGGLPREHQFGTGLGDYVVVTDGAAALPAADGYLTAYRTMTGTTPGAGLANVVQELSLWADEAEAVLSEPEPTTSEPTTLAEVYAAMDECTACLSGDDTCEHVSAAAALDSTTAQPEPVRTLTGRDDLPATPVLDLQPGDIVRRTSENYAGAEVGTVVRVHAPEDHEPWATVRYSDGEWSGTGLAWTRLSDDVNGPAPIYGTATVQGWPYVARVLTDGTVEWMGAAGTWRRATDSEGATFVPDWDLTDGYRADAGLSPLSAGARAVALADAAQALAETMPEPVRCWACGGFVLDDADPNQHDMHAACADRMLSADDVAPEVTTGPSVTEVMAAEPEPVPLTAAEVVLVSYSDETGARGERVFSNLADAVEHYADLVEFTSGQPFPGFPSTDPETGDVVGSDLPERLPFVGWADESTAQHGTSTTGHDVERGCWSVGLDVLQPVPVSVG